MYDGYVGFFTQPYKGARDGGALGLMKGITKGCAGLLTQPAHGIFGVVAYPALGLYKSLNTKVRYLERRKIWAFGLLRMSLVTKEKPRGC